MHIVWIPTAFLFQWWWFK